MTFLANILYWPTLRVLQLILIPYALFMMVGDKLARKVCGW
jgi:hypothetical protein